MRDNFRQKQASVDLSKSGQQRVLQGLSATPELNGRTTTVLWYQKTTEKFVVRLLPKASSAAAAADGDAAAAVPAADAEGVEVEDGMILRLSGEYLAVPGEASVV